MPTQPPVIATPWEPSRLVAWLDRIEQAIERLNLFELLELPTTGSGEHVQMAYHQIARTRHPDLFRGKLTARDAERLMRVYGRISAAYASLRDPNERTRYIYELRQQRGRTSSNPPAATAVPDRDGPLGRGTGPSVAVSVGRAPTPPTPAISRTATPSSPAISRTQTSISAPAIDRTPTAPVPTRPTTAPDRPRTSSPAPARGAPLSTPPPLGSPRLPVVPATQLAPRALAFYRRAETALASGDVAAATLNLRMALSAVQRHGKGAIAG